MEDNEILSSFWHHSKVSWMQTFDLFIPPFPPQVSCLPQVAGCLHENSLFPTQSGRNCSQTSAIYTWVSQ